MHMSPYDRCSFLECAVLSILLPEEITPLKGAKRELFFLKKGAKREPESQKKGVPRHKN